MASNLTSKQRLAYAICDFLNTCTTDGTLPADEADNIEVAINCLAESFKITPSDPEITRAAVGQQTLLQIFTVYEALRQSKDKTASATGKVAAVATAAAASSSSSEISAESKKKAEELKSKGNAAMASKDYPAAIDFYTQALAIDPGNAVYLSNRAAAHSAAKDHTSARTDAEKATTLDPSYTKGWSRLGLARFALGDPRGAMEAYQNGIDAEGNGGSEAMKKGFETAKRRVEETEGTSVTSREASSPAASTSAGIGASSSGSGGFPDLSSLLGGGGGGGGMPDFGSMMNNPMFQQMASSLMSNPEMMNNLMSNPRLKQMADSFTNGGSLPDMSQLMNDPSLAEIARNMMGGGAGRGGSK